MDLASVRLRCLGREVSAFRLWGTVGFLAACAVALGVSDARGLSLAHEAGIIALSVCVFLGLALASRAISGVETLVYYHHEVGVLAAAAGLAALLHAPVLDHLDATALGLGAFLAFGRIGCLLVGCCHGRPARHGIRYGADHVAAGLPAYLEGSRLLPVQALEAVAVGALVSTELIWAPATPGSAFGLYVTGYAVLRFALEELRGDPCRRLMHGLSEAQWTSLTIVISLTAFAAGGLVPELAVHAAASALLLAAAPLVARRGGSLLDPGHVRELATALCAPPAGRPVVNVTSLGLRISWGRAANARHYTLTLCAGELRTEDAAALARVLSWLSGARGQPQLVAGAAGAVHVVFLDEASGRPHGPPVDTSTAVC
jgi:hypothetical protein